MQAKAVAQAAEDERYIQEAARRNLNAYDQFPVWAQHGMHDDYWISHAGDYSFDEGRCAPGDE
eukprot:7935185-Heterocapsa_arctica.AAC.1